MAAAKTKSKSNPKKIVIIGAGIAGLSAGIYARRQGYDVTIYETHFLPGGLCTSWKRGGYTFEGCMHYVGLVGASPAHTSYAQWEDLGVFPGLSVVHHEIFHTFRDTSGRTFNLYSDIDRLEAEMRSLSPADTVEIKSLCKAVKRYTWFIRSTGKNPLKMLAKGIGILCGIPVLKKYGELNMGEYAARFRDPLLREAFTYLFGYPDFACTNIFFFLAGLHFNGAGFPRGSSLAFAQAIERTFLDLGGEIKYRTRVRQIQVAENRAAGIVLADNTVVKADIVISAADGHTVLTEMLQDKFTPPALRERFETRPVYPPFIQVSLGVNRDLSDLPHAVKAQTAESFEIAGESRRKLWFQHYAFDQSMAPPGKTALTVIYPSDLAWWDQLGYQSTAYQAEKEKVLVATIAQLNQIIPGIAADIEVTDVATPGTSYRYTHNWQAALGFMMTKSLSGEMVLNPQYELPGLADFYMIGMWVKGFGLPMAAASGKEVLAHIKAKSA